LRDLRELLLQTLDDLLAEVRALGKLLLDLFVDLNLALVSLDLRFHFVVLVDQDLRLLRLMFEFGRELMVLKDGQVRCGLQLLVVHRQQVSFRLLDVEEHFLPQLLCLLDPVELFLVDLLEAKRFLTCKPLP